MKLTRKKMVRTRVVMVTLMKMSAQPRKERGTPQLLAHFFL